MFKILYCKNLREVLLFHRVIFFILLLTILSPLSLRSDDLKIEGLRFICFEDGCQELYLVRNTNTGERLSVPMDELTAMMRKQSIVSANDEEITLVPRPFIPFPEVNGQLKVLRFHFNHVAASRRELFTRVARELIAGIRGTKKKPRFVFDSEVIDTSDYSEEDFETDGINMFFIHEDDKTWLPEYAATPLGKADVYIDLENYVVSSMDISFTYYNFTQTTEDRLVQCLVHEMGHIYGFLHTSWVEDVMSYAGPWYVYNHRWPEFEEMFWREKSWVWKISRNKDKLAYGGKTKKGVYESKVEILPLEGSAIELDFLWMESPAGYRKHFIASTVLKGYRKRPLQLEIYRGEKIHENRLIVWASGYHEVFARKKYAKLFANYKTSDLHFARAEEYNKLREAVLRWGKPRVFRTLQYSHALWTTLVVTGYDSPESEEPRSLSTKVWFAILDY